MYAKSKKLLTRLAPILGAGAIGVCPVCWLGSASLLTYLGLGAFITAWIWFIALLFGLSILGFVLDYRSHKNIYPLILLSIGGVLLYVGRYVFGGGGFTGWQIWGPGIIIVLVAIIYNKRQFKKEAPSIKEEDKEETQTNKNEHE